MRYCSALPPPWCWLMISPGISRRTSAGRPWGRSSKSRPGMICSDEDEIGGGAVTVTGGKTVSGGGGGTSCPHAGDESRATRMIRGPAERTSVVTGESYYHSHDHVTGPDVTSIARSSHDLSIRGSGAPAPRGE